MVFCPDCGTQNDDSAAFCGNCGYNFKETSTTNPPAANTTQPSQPQQQPQPGYQQPATGFIPVGQQNIGQFAMSKKDKAGPMILSFFFMGLGMLMVDSNKYGGKALGIFLGGLFVTFVIPVVGILLGFIAWIIGLVWTSQAVDEYNRELAIRYGVSIY